MVGYGIDQKCLIPITVPVPVKIIPVYGMYRIPVPLPVFIRNALNNMIVSFKNI
jgi:hypothetical protein